MNTHNPEPRPQDEFSDLWDIAKNYTPSETAQNDRAWQKFEATLKQEKKISKPATLSIAYRRVLSYAAVIALLVLSGYMYFQPETTAQIAQTTETTTSKQAREITLPDGSTAMLAANSEITYRFSESQRQIELKGHARFEVARNEKAPFTVQTPTTQITVLGTGFDVHAYPNTPVKVFVNHGKVKVENAKQEIILTKNQGVLSTENELNTWNQNQNPLIVNSEYLKFDNAPLDFVLETLKNSNDMQFIVSQNNLNQPHFTGTLTFKQNADEVAALLSAALSIEIKSIK